MKKECPGGCGFFKGHDCQCPDPEGDFSNKHRETKRFLNGKSKPFISIKKKK